MLELYKIYLRLIEKKLSNFFAKQKPYICCKEGCAYCCQNAQFPYTQVEFNYLMFGFAKLDKEKQDIVLGRVYKIKEEKNKFQPIENEKFEYDCPFLIDNKCSVYENRGIICRVFGLPYFVEGSTKIKVPFCMKRGLNYSGIYDEETEMFLKEKMDELGIEQEPLAYNLSLKYLLNNEATEYLGLKFGESKSLIDWF